MRTTLWAILVVVLVAALLLTPIPVRWQGDWQGKFFDLGHVPLFGVMTVLLRLLLPRPWYAAPLIALTEAALAEVAQNYVGRDGNFPDFLRGGLGVFAALVALRAWQERPGILRLGCYALALAGLLAWPVGDAAPWLLDALDGFRSFPILAEFGTAREVRRWHCDQAALERMQDPARPGQWVGCLELLPGPQQYPGAVLHPIVRDWRQYGRLCWAFRVENEHLDLVFSLRSGPDAQGQTTHYQQGRRFGRGNHLFEVDLLRAAREAEEGPLDLSNVRAVQIFTESPEQAKAIFLERIWLE
jgi:hypothetical protein